MSVFTFSRSKLTFLKNNKRQFLFLAISSVAMGTSWMFLYEAYQHVGVSVASLAYYCGPVIVMALSPVLFHERLTWPKLTGFITVLCGICFMNGHALEQGGSRWGIFCGAMSAVTYAIMVIFNKKVKDISGLENSMLQLFISFLTVSLFVVVKQGFIINIQSSDWLPILILGLINTGVGCFFYLSSIGFLPVQSVSICGYLEPLSAVIFSFLFLKETMRPMQMIGAVLIISGALFGEYIGLRLFGRNTTQ